MARKRGAPRTASEDKSPSQRRKLNPKPKQPDSETPKISKTSKTPKALKTPKTPKEAIIEKKSPEQKRKSSARLKRKLENDTLKTPIEKKSTPQKRKVTPKSKRKSVKQTPKTASGSKSPSQSRKKASKEKIDSEKHATPKTTKKDTKDLDKEVAKTTSEKDSAEDQPKKSPILKREADYEPRLVTKTVLSAVEALKKDGARSKKKRAGKSNKIEDEEDEKDEMFVHLVVTLKQAPFKQKLRPYRIPLKRSLYTPGEAEVCFFVKDPQRLMKDYLDEHGHGGVTRVMGVDKLRKRYSTYEGRNELVDEYDLFLVDNRVAPMMPSLLGKVFMEKKKMPLAVDVRRDVVSSIQKMMSGTTLLLRQGSCLNVKIGKMGFEVDDLVENVEMAMQGVVQKIEGGWNDVQAVSLKSDKSPALPIYRQDVAASES